MKYIKNKKLLDLITLIKDSKLFSPILALLKYSTYFYGIFKGFKILFILIRFISALMTGSLLVAFYSLLDLKAEFTDL